MLYHLALWAQSSFSWCNMLHYISFRAIAALMSTFLVSLLLGQKFITFSKDTFQNTDRPFAPEGHKGKGQTPTMGGLLILAITVINLIVWCDLSKSQLWITIITLLSFGAIGFIDDYYKVMYKRGLTARSKMMMQLLASLVTATALMYFVDMPKTVSIPFFKEYNPDLGLFYIVWVMLILVASSNAVNLTDGLDGLAIGTLLSNFAVFSIVGYLSGHCLFATYLQIPFTGYAELAIIGSVLIGSSLGFLWFNAHPAQIFMGDVGSLSLGAVLGLMAILSKQELLLPIAGGMFVLEALSVMIQYFMVKYYKKRLFKMAPIHHHFELLGWQEPKITVRFNIISAMLCLLALITLKVR